MARTDGLHRRINRYLTPQTVISHHEARLSANSLCPVLQIYGAFYTSKSVYIELQHYATSTTLIRSFFLFLKGAEQVKKKGKATKIQSEKLMFFLCYSGRENKPKRRRLLISCHGCCQLALLWWLFVSPSSHDKIAQRGV